jgi:hypothetical protein
MKNFDKIKEWKINDAFRLISELKNLNVAVSSVWVHDTCEVVLTNPDAELIRALKQNKKLWKTFWHSTMRGNIYTFLISPRDLGYKKVPEYAKEKNIPRQYVYNSRYKYDLVYQSPQKVWVREKK